MTEAPKEKADHKASNLYKLMGGLYIFSLLAAIPGSAVSAGLVIGLLKFANVSWFLPQVIGFEFLTFFPATFIAFIAPGD